MHLNLLVVETEEDILLVDGPNLPVSHGNCNTQYQKHLSHCTPLLVDSFGPLVITHLVSLLTGQLRTTEARFNFGWQSNFLFHVSLVNMNTAHISWVFIHNLAWDLCYASAGWYTSTGELCCEF